MAISVVGILGSILIILIALWYISKKRKQKNKTKKEESVRTAAVGNTDPKRGKIRDSLELAGGAKKGNAKVSPEALGMEYKVYYRGEVSVIELSENYDLSLEIVWGVLKTNVITLHYEDGDDFVDICTGSDWKSFQSKKCDLVVKDK